MENKSYYEIGKRSAKRGGRRTVDTALSDAERSFLTWWRGLTNDLPEPVSQYKFNRFRIDFAWPDQKIAVEIDGSGGGGYGRSVVCHRCGATVRARKKDGSPGKALRVPYASHGSGDGRARDAEKSNSLQLAGWLILRYTTLMLNQKPEFVIAEVADALIDRSV